MNEHERSGRDSGERERESRRAMNERMDEQPAAAELPICTARPSSVYRRRAAERTPELLIA